MKKTEGTVTISLRLPAELHARLVDIADADERSLNQWLVRLLRDAVSRWSAEQH